LSDRAALIIGLVAGSILRIVQIATSIGSVDSYFWTRHVQMVEKFGVLRAYHAAQDINHPPFALEIARLTARLGALAHLQFFDTFRILQGLADIVTTFALLRLARRFAPDSAVFIALAYFLSPAAIFISAFHCNSDPLMVMFIVLAIVAIVEQRPILGGLLIACAAGIKIIALPAIPLLFLACRGKKAKVGFTAVVTIVTAAIFVPGLVVSGMVMVRNIFGYTGWRGGWGLPLILDLIDYVNPHLFSIDAGKIVTPFLIIGAIVLWAAEARRGVMEESRVPRVIGVLFLLILFFAPGFGVQYLIWILPYPALLFSRRAAIALHAIIGVFVFWLYTSWAKEWPWVYAEGANNSAAVGMFGLVAWAAIGVALIAAARALYRSERAPA
jgi:hypothetical protein